MLIKYINFETKNMVYFYSFKNVKVLLKCNGILLFYSAFCHKKFLVVQAHLSKC